MTIGAQLTYRCACGIEHDVHSGLMVYPNTPKSLRTARAGYFYAGCSSCRRSALWVSDHLPASVVSDIKRHVRWETTKSDRESHGYCRAYPVPHRDFVAMEELLKGQAVFTA